MRIVSWNVNGIRAIAKKGFADRLKEMDADIVCIQETKASIDQLEAGITNIDGYQSYFHSAERKGYSGTAIYTRVSPLSVTYGLGVDEFDHEGRTIIATFEDFVLLNIYFPNGTSGDERIAFKLRFYDCFIHKILELKKLGKQIIVCGDVNTAHNEIDLSNPKANSKLSGFLPEERVYIDKFIEIGLVDTFRKLHPDETEKYSWWSYKTFARDRNVGWRIDYFFATKETASRITESNMFSDVMGSDHCPVFIDIP